MTSESPAFLSLRPLAELTEAEVVLQPLPLPAERSLGYGSSGFELQPSGDLPDIFSDPDSSGNPDHEYEHKIAARKTSMKINPETCSACKKLRHRSSE